MSSSFGVAYSQSPQNISNLNTFIQEKLNPGSTFNPGLVLIGFRTTWSRALIKKIWHSVNTNRT